MSEAKFLGKDQVEAIVRGDLKKRYPKIKSFEFKSVVLQEYWREWWLTGFFATETEIKRGFSYHLNAETGEIKRYEMRW